MWLLCRKECVGDLMPVVSMPRGFSWMRRRRTRRSASACAARIYTMMAYSETANTRNGFEVKDLECLDRQQNGW